MGCKEASSPMSKIRKLYKREDLYVEKGYDAEKIKEMRNDEYTRGIVDELQNEMFDLMANKMDKLPKLMQQALNYLHKFWKQVFAYRNDGEYSIDNLAAERAIRPQTIQRKGSLFFGSVQGALRSAMYNTVWLTQQQIADLFGTKRPAITKHLRNIFNSGELDQNSVSSILEHTAADGKTYKTQFYNLDAIISVGYRVNSINATAFRRWATRVLNNYLLKGYSVNQQLLAM